jgi:hypothetical protein
MSSILVRSIGAAALALLILTSSAGAATATEVAESSLAATLDPAAVRCAFAKMRAALKKATALNVCLREALASNTAPDPACLDAVDARFHATFEKLDARGGCVLTGDANRIGRLVNQFSIDLVRGLDGTCLPAGSSCGGVLTPCCAGLSCEAEIGEDATCR